MSNCRYAKDYFGPNLKYLRGTKSQNEVAKDLGISASTLSQYEKSLRIPNIDILIKISDYYNVTPNSLLENNLGRQSNASFIIDDEILTGNRTLSDPSILKKFEQIELNCYYYSASRPNKIREGKLRFNSRYGEREFVAGQIKTHRQRYSCKLVVEGNDSYYVYGINMNRPERMVMAFHDHEFLSNQDPLEYGVGLCLSTSSRGRIISQIVVLSSIRIIGNPKIENADKIIRSYLDMSKTSSTGFILSNDVNADLSKWLIKYTPPHKLSCLRFRLHNE